MAFSCKQRCTCPSCHQKRTLLTAIHVAEDVCAPVAHRQVVLTIPKRLRVHTRFDRKLLGKLCAAAWACIQAEVRRQLGRDDVVPGMIAAIQTHGELLHWHPHIHTLVTCGAFTAEGEFLEVPELDMGRLETAWQEAVFALYLAKEKIEPEVVENMRGWPHSGFSVDQSVFLPAGDRAGIERLVGYMTRCPFSLSRLVKVTETECGKGDGSNLPERPGGCCAQIGPVPFSTGQVIYKAEKQVCRAFPEANGDGLRPGPKRNFQVLDPLDFLAEFTQHIPPKGSHLIRYYGWYSNKARGMRRKAAEAEAAKQAGATSSSEASEAASPSRESQTWAMLIKRVYEIDPLACPHCGGQMKVVAFIEPPQGAVIEKILRHCGLWRPSTPRAPPPEDGWVYEPDAEWDSQPASSDSPGDLTFVEIDEFLATFLSTL